MARNVSAMRNRGKAMSLRGQDSVGTPTGVHRHIGRVDLDIKLNRLGCVELMQPWIKPFYANDLIPTSDQDAVIDAVATLKELPSIPHGSGVSYRTKPAKWAPAFGHNEPGMRQYVTATRHFQDGLLETLARLSATRRARMLRTEDLTCTSALAPPEAAVPSPSADDLTMPSQLRHCASFEPAGMNPIVQAKCPDTEANMWRPNEQPGWKFGTFRAWHDAVGSKSGRCIADFARRALCEVGERPLQQAA